MAKPKKIKLKDVTAENWEAVADLELTKDQKKLVDENVYSIAESKFDPHAVLRAAYAGRKLVGFIMYDPCVDDGRPHDYLIYRFMIDRRQQGKGYGRGTLERVIEEIHQDPEWRRIVICYMPSNKAARKFYASLGFVETGIDEDGEIIAEIRRRT
jgi:diamine N-acetyltransferase